MKVKIVLAALCGFLLGVMVCLAPQVRYVYFPYQVINQSTDGKEKIKAYTKIDRLTGQIWHAYYDGNWIKAGTYLTTEQAIFKFKNK